MIGSYTVRISKPNTFSKKDNKLAHGSTNQIELIRVSLQNKEEDEADI